MGHYDRIMASIGALSVPFIAIISYFRRKSLRVKLDTLDEKFNKRIDDLMAAIIKSQ